MRYTLAPQVGSSPRVWGQVAVKMHCLTSTGIIPTRMGTRTSTNFAPSGLTDHPHAYGDKKKRKSVMCMADGSSPRVWGQVDINSKRPEIYRIIPTRMGTRPTLTAMRPTGRDHPHAYGDKYCSSTHTVYFARIIPTRMGTRSEVPQQRPARQDHPHAYGDKVEKAGFTSTVKGSSPRVWGQGITPFFPICEIRIIPTRMGTSICHYKTSFV